jgi:hypothetical protein
VMDRLDYRGVPALALALALSDACR